MARRAKLRVVKTTKGKWLIEGLRINGERKRIYHDTKAQAELELARIGAQQRREGQEAFELTTEQRVEAAKAIAILQEHDVGLVDAARHYAAHIIATKRSISFAALREKMLAAKKADGRAKDHVSDLRWRSKRFENSFGDRLVEEITTLEIDDWLRNEAQGQNRNNFRKVLHGVFSFALNAGYCRANPVAKAAKAKVLRGAPPVLNPAELRRLMAASKQEIIPYIAISAFAGLRTSEVQALDWANVDLDNARIQVNPIHKTGQRWVTISPNLLKWLWPYRRPTGPVSPKKANRKRGVAAKKAGIKWKVNVLRHSFGSAHSVHFRNETLTANLMGNTRRVLIEHYKNLIKPEHAAEWWEIMPPDATDGVIPFLAAEA